MWEHKKNNGNLSEIYFIVKLCHSGGLNLALSHLNYKSKYFEDSQRYLLKDSIKRPLYEVMEGAIFSE